MWYSAGGGKLWSKTPCTAVPFQTTGFLPPPEHPSTYTKWIKANIFCHHQSVVSVNTEEGMVVYSVILLYSAKYGTHPPTHQVEQLADPLAKNFVVEFSWRAETMASFFTSPDSSTSSAMVKIEYEVTFFTRRSFLRFAHVA